MALKKALWVKQLLKKACVTIESSEDTRVKVKKRRDERRSDSGAESGKKNPNFGQKTLADAIGQNKKDEVNWYTVQDWFWKEIMRVNPAWAVVKEKKDEEEQTGWTWNEKNCAQRLLKHYGAEVVRNTVIWFVDNWQAMKDRSDGALTGAPTVNLLWVSRERIFPDAQAGIVIKPKRKARRKKKKHMVGEYDDDRDYSKIPKVGW
jgi:hypothetical protein